MTELDLSGFNTAGVTNFSYMFINCINLKTIYISNLWNMSSMNTGNQMFNNCPSLVGGDGTVYDSSKINYVYARIDDLPDNPGYFTDIADKPSV